MTKRIFSTVALWGGLGGLLWLFGPHAAVWILALLAVLTLHEFYHITSRLGAEPFRRISYTFAVLMIVGPYYLTEFFFEGEEEATGLAPLLLALAVVVCAVRVLGERDNPKRVDTLTATLLGLFYVPFMLQYLVRLLMLYPDSIQGLAACLWVVAVSKFCDVGALLTGLAIGRHKMSPHISPKKTWEGAVGGVLISVGIGSGLARLFTGYGPEALTPGVAALIALPLAIIAIISDLIESLLKRHADIKDAGALIPGIGGAFDLTDSLILTAPVAYGIFFFLS